jgi:hypothetical protein
MKSYVFILLNICFLHAAAQADEQIIERIFAENLGKGHAYENLEYLSKEIGNRINGSPQLAAAIEYSRQLMLNYNFDTVYLQPVMIPNWKRGDTEIVRIINSPYFGNKELDCISFGNSVGTGPIGISGEIVEFRGMESLMQAKDEQIQGKIVFLNKTINPEKYDILEEYGKNSGLRKNGASIAAEKGATAFILRSLSIGTDHYAHTGNMSYANDDRKIPALAIGHSEANLLSELIEKEPGAKLYIETHCKTYDDVLSYNVIGEIKGIEFPDEVIVVGGHIDSWDVGEAAHDDGAGCIQSIEAAGTFKAIGVSPKRTIRVVLWTDEENRLSGAKAYAKMSKELNIRHIAAIESDLGGFLPLGFYLDTDNEVALKRIDSWEKYFHPYGMFEFVEVPEVLPVFDIAPLKNDDILLLGLKPSLQQYVSIYHSEKDVFESVNKRELALGAAAMASMVYLIDKYGLE